MQHCLRLPVLSCSQDKQEGNLREAQQNCKDNKVHFHARHAKPLGYHTFALPRKRLHGVLRIWALQLIYRQMTVCVTLSVTQYAFLSPSTLFCNLSWPLLLNAVC